MFHQKSKRRLAWDSAGRLKGRVSRPGRDKFQPATTKSRAPDQAGPFSSFRVNKVRSDPKVGGAADGHDPDGSRDRPYRAPTGKATVMSDLKVQPPRRKKQSQTPGAPREGLRTSCGCQLS